MITAKDLDDWRDEQLAQIRKLEALAELKENTREGGSWEGEQVVRSPGGSRHTVTRPASGR